MTEGRERQLDAGDYRQLADFRYALRWFLHFSEEAARRAGLTPQQHQLLLAIKGFPERREPTVGDAAERLGVRHHSAVALAQRLEEAGLLQRIQDRHDRRRVLLRLTAESEEVLARLAQSHLDELQRLGHLLVGLLGAASESAGCNGIKHLRLGDHRRTSTASLVFSDAVE